MPTNPNKEYSARTGSAWGIVFAAFGTAGFLIFSNASLVLFCLLDLISILIYQSMREEISGDQTVVPVTFSGRRYLFHGYLMTVLGVLVFGFATLNIGTLRIAALGIGVYFIVAHIDLWLFDTKSKHEARTTSNLRGSGRAEMSGTVKIDFMRRADIGLRVVTVLCHVAMVGLFVVVNWETIRIFVR